MDAAYQGMLLERGITLFNDEAFWEAHEAWEELWLASEGPRRSWLQGLIQTAAALVHWQRGNPRGLQLNWAKARPKLCDLPAAYGGIDLRSLIAWMDAMTDGTNHHPPRLIHSEPANPDCSNPGDAA